MRTLLGITLAAQLVLFAFTAVSWGLPKRRIWPPPAGDRWQIHTIWFLSWVSLSGVFLLALLGGNTLGLPGWLRLGAGVPLLSAGIATIAWAFRELSVQTTLGREGRLVQSGPYAWSRNPQYVGACAYLASLVLLSGSHLAAIACLAVAPWFLVTPFVEEPWLAERYGDEYREYCRSVPRFLG